MGPDLRGHPVETSWRRLEELAAAAGRDGWRYGKDSLGGGSREGRHFRRLVVDGAGAAGEEPWRESRGLEPDQGEP